MKPERGCADLFRSEREGERGKRPFPYGRTLARAECPSGHPLSFFLGHARATCDAHSCPPSPRKGSAARRPDQRVVRPGSTTGETGPFGSLSATGGIVNAEAALRMAEQVSASSR